MNWGCDTALYRTAEAMRAELPTGSQPARA